MTRDEFCDWLKTAKDGSKLKFQSEEIYEFDGIGKFNNVTSEHYYTLDYVYLYPSEFKIVSEPRKKELMLNLSKENCDSIFIDIDDFKLLNYMSHACFYSPDIEQDSMKIKITVEEIFE